MSIGVNIICPSCGVQGGIELPTTLFSNIPKGLATVNVPAEAVCEHSFQVFIDRNGIVRGYQRVDFELELKQEIRNTVENALKELKRIEISLHGILSLLTTDIFLRILKCLLLRTPITIVCSNAELVDVLQAFFGDKFPEFAKCRFISELDYVSQNLDVPGLVVDLNLKIVNQDPVKNRFFIGQDWVKEIWQYNDAVSQKISFTSFINNLFNRLEILTLFVSQQTGTIKFESFTKLFKEKANISLRKEEIEFLLEMLKVHQPELEQKVETFEKRVKNIEFF